MTTPNFPPGIPQPDMTPQIAQRVEERREHYKTGCPVDGHDRAALTFYKELYVGAAKDEMHFVMNALYADECWVTATLDTEDAQETVKKAGS